MPIIALAPQARHLGCADVVTKVIAGLPREIAAAKSLQQKLGNKRFSLKTAKQQFRSISSIII